MRLIAYVHGENEMAPSYALIEISDPESLKIRLDLISTVSKLLGNRGQSRAEGEMFSTLLWLGSLKSISVTWLQRAALADPEDVDPEWVEDLDQYNLVVPPADWEPREDEFRSVDLVKLEVYPDGTMDVQANLWGGPDRVETQEFSLKDFEV